MITKVQTAGFSPPSVAEYTTSGMANFAVGDLITINFGGSRNARISSITGGGVTTWVKAVQAVNPEQTEDAAEIWYGVVTAGGTNNAITVKFTIATSAFDPLVVCEWAGAGALDKTTANTGKSTTMATALAKPSAAGELFIAIGRIYNEGATGGATGGWTELSAAGHGGNRSAFIIAAASGEEATSWTLPTDFWAVAMATFIPLPVVTKPASQTSTRGTAISPLTIEATGTTEYKASGLPAGLSINAGTGVITGTPTTVEETTVTVTVKGPGGEASTTFTWTIHAEVVAGPVAPAMNPTIDVTVRLQALSGTWETCGADRAIKVIPETLTCSANEWGPDKASFQLHRSPIALWPDIGAFTPVEIEIGGVVRWEGRIGETPLKLGSEQIINIQCEGWQYQLDDDVYQRMYVHSKLTDWKDSRSFIGADLTRYTGAGTAGAQQGVITLGWAKGTVSKNNDAVGVTLDLGPNGSALRVVIELDRNTVNNEAVHLYVRGTNNDNAISAAIATDAISNLQVNTANGFYSGNFSKQCRYVTIFLINTGAEVTWGPDQICRIKAAYIFAETAYESGNASILHASTIIRDAVERGTLLLSSDYSQIAATSFPIPDFTLSKLSSPREASEAANAYHNYRMKLLIGRRVSFQPRPTEPLLEIGAWSGASLEDTSANSGAEIYNRATVEAVGAAGSPLVAERTASAQPGVAFNTVSSPAPENPSFATNTTGWTVFGGTITRDTVTFDSGPASGKVSAGATVETPMVGAFKAGNIYVIRAMVRAENAGVLLQANIASTLDVAFATVSPAAGIWTPLVVYWTPRANTSSATFGFLQTGSGAYWIDSISVATAAPTLVDRRGFRRTKVIQMSSAITAAEGNQIADIFLQAHMTTPFKGSASLSPGSVRTVLGGQRVHPSALLTATQELLRLSHLTDPDTGGIGRDGTIAEVTYTHKDQKASVVLDDKRANFDALLSRLAVVQSVGS